MMLNSKPLLFGLTIAGLVLGLAGCGGITDRIGDLNPFDRGEDIMPGDRQPVLTGGGNALAGATLSGKSASISAAVALSDWPQPGGNAANAPGNVSLSGGDGALLWRASTSAKVGKKGVRASAPPLAVGGRFYVYDAGGTVTALAGAGGRQWSVSLKPEGENSLTTGGGIAAAGNVIVAATGYGELVALDAATGGRAWTYKLREPARGAPTAAGGKAYVVTASNVLHAVNMADGSEAWTYAGIPENAGILSAASPAVAGNTVIVPYTSGEVIAFDAGTGQPKWSDSVIRAVRTAAVSGLSDISASPVASNGVVFATGVSGRTIAVKLSNGERLWEENVGSAYTPAVSGNAVFLIDLDDNLVALERATGKAFWSTRLPVVRKKRFFSVWAGPMLAGSKLWAVSNDGRLIAVEPATGQILFERKLAGPAFIKPTAAGGRLYVLAGDGSLLALR
jgi:outer membrane protein assembly factor BamB